MKKSNARVGGYRTYHDVIVSDVDPQCTLHPRGCFSCDTQWLIQLLLTSASARPTSMFHM